MQRLARLLLLLLLCCMFPACLLQSWSADLTWKAVAVEKPMLIRQRSDGWQQGLKVCGGGWQCAHGYSLRFYRRSCGGQGARAGGWVCGIAHGCRRPRVPGLAGRPSPRFTSTSALRGGWRSPLRRPLPPAVPPLGLFVCCTFTSPACAHRCFFEPCAKGGGRVPPPPPPPPNRGRDGTLLVAPFPGAQGHHAFRSKVLSQILLNVGCVHAHARGGMCVAQRVRGGGRATAPKPQWRDFGLPPCRGVAPAAAHCASNAML